MNLAELSRFVEILRSRNVEVIVSTDAHKELQNFKGNDFVVTNALSADEKTGLIFMGGFESKKEASLAEHHVIVLKAEDIKKDAISAYRLASSKSDCIFASSSPSKTADIEGKTVFGMHGPRKLTVILEIKEEV